MSPQLYVLLGFLVAVAIGFILVIQRADRILAQTETAAKRQEEAAKPAAGEKEKTASWLTAEQFDQYRGYENAENWALGRIVAFYYKMYYVEKDAEGKNKETNLFKDAYAIFGQDSFWAEDASLTDFLVENYDEAWYVLNMMGEGKPEAEVQKFWGLSDENTAKYVRVAARIRSVSDQVFQTALQNLPAAGVAINQAAVDVIKANFPTFETALTVFYDGLVSLAKKREAEAAEKAAKEAAEKAAKDAAEKAAKEPTDKPGKDPKAAQPKEEAPKPADAPKQPAAPAPGK